MSFVEMMTEKDTFTANGAVTNSTSHNACVDLFFLAGACRRESEQNIVAKLTAAYVEDRVKCLKIIFWAGDIRQGAGERRFFQLAIKWLSENHPNDVQNHLSWFVEMNRWDSLFEIAHTNNVAFSFIISNLIDPESKNRGLLCKWLPRKKQYNNLASKIRKQLGCNAKEYRQMLVRGTQVVETQMCKKQWNEIDYSKVPSVAINKYNKAWYRNDQARFEQYLEAVKSGKSKINASVIFPHDIIKGHVSCGWNNTIKPLNEAQIVQWNNLPNYMEGGSILPVCDVSGSMSGTPMDISIALGLYLSERNTGLFKDAFMTFSARPKLQYLHGNINERMQQLATADWDQNTDLVAVFRLILQRALEYKLPVEDMPKTILVISDMEFDCCGRLTNYEVIKQAYQESGYECPNIVFWNVNGRAGNLPVTVNDKGVALISGASPSIVKSVLGNELSSVKIMNKVIESDRYSFVV